MTPDNHDTPTQERGEQPVPFLDLSGQYLSLQQDVRAAIQRVLDRVEYIGGPEVTLFEQEFAGYLGAAHCVALSSGTAALTLALRAMGVGPGDEVVTQPNTFIATAAAVALVGARPVFADIEPDGIFPSIDGFLSATNQRTKAFIPVHLFGFPYPRIDELVAAAHVRGIHVLEDACQAHGATWRGRSVGTFGRAAAFSFYPGKNLGAYGDAGAVVTDDASLASTLMELRNHGSLTKCEHERVGGTERMDSLQAAILRVKLPRLNAWNEQRRAAARYYNDALEGVPGLWVPHELAGQLPCYHLYVVRHRQVSDLESHLRSRGIQWGRHYPVPCHLTKAFAYLGLCAGSMPNAEQACATGLSLPMYPEIPRLYQKRVVEAVKEFCARGG